MNTYTAVARRSGGWWAISVPELKGVHSQARRLDQAEGVAREAIALFLDVAPASFAVNIEPEAPAEVAHIRTARGVAERAATEAEQVTSVGVQHLLAAGYTVRDIGRMLDLSPQRISQIGTQGRASAA